MVFAVGACGGACILFGGMLLARLLAVAVAFARARVWVVVLDLAMFDWSMALTSLHC